MDKEAVRFHEAFDPLFAQYDKLMAEIAEYKKQKKIGESQVAINERGNDSRTPSPLGAVRRYELQEAQKRANEALDKVNKSWLGD